MVDSSKGERLNYLDSIRGIAALTVLLLHCWLATANASVPSFASAFLSLPNLLSYCSRTLIVKLFAGPAAVMVFFVLSGFVLTYSLKKHPETYLGYGVKRICRIYPAFLFTVVLSYTLHCLLGVRYAASSRWLAQDVVSADLSLSSLGAHLLMYGTKAGRQLDIPVWSLVHEMRISLLFPLVLLSVRRRGKYAVLLWGLISIICAVTPLLITGDIVTGADETTVWASFLATGLFIVFFAAGALLALERQRIGAAIASWPIGKTVLAGGVTLLCLFCPYPTNDHLKFPALNYMYLYMYGGGAVLLIALASGRATFSDFLNHGVLVWLGRISYSLYLIHVPVIYVLSQTIGEAWSFWPMTAVVAALSLVGAQLMEKYIERAGIKAGRKFVTYTIPSPRQMAHAIDQRGWP